MFTRGLMYTPEPIFAPNRRSSPHFKRAGPRQRREKEGAFQQIPERLDPAADGRDRDRGARRTDRCGRGSCAQQYARACALQLLHDRRPAIARLDGAPARRSALGDLSASDRAPGPLERLGERVDGRACTPIRHRPTSGRRRCSRAWRPPAPRRRAPRARSSATLPRTTAARTGPPSAAGALSPPPAPAR